MNKAQLIQAARSYAACRRQEKHKPVVYIPGEPRPNDDWDMRGWAIHCRECGSWRGVSDNEVVIRALILRELGVC